MGIFQSKNSLIYHLWIAETEVLEMFDENDDKKFSKEEFITFMSKTFYEQCDGISMKFQIDLFRGCMRRVNNRWLENDKQKQSEKYFVPGQT